MYNRHNTQSSDIPGGQELESSADLGWAYEARPIEDIHSFPHTDGDVEGKSHSHANSSNPHPNNSYAYEASRINMALNQLYEQGATAARSIVDSYLEWWTKERLFRLKTKRPTEDHAEAQTGRLSPRIYAKSKEPGTKLYIEWGDHRSPKVKSINPSWSRPVKPTARGYTEEQLRRLADQWEADRVVETEAQLAVIRATMDAIHLARVTIGRAIRYSKQ